MCGIGVLYKSSSSTWNEEDVKQLLECIANRGPDARDTTRVKQNMVLLASVLHLRGVKCMMQPFSTKDSHDVLLWNGEVFGGRPVVSRTQSDTRQVFEAISSATADTTSKKNVGMIILKVLDMIEGPWAVMYWHHKTQSLWFGRDRLGRRSLLLRFEREDDVLKSLRISSALPESERNKYIVPADKVRYELVESVWQAIPPIGLFGVCFDGEDNLCGFEHIPRSSSTSSSSSPSSKVSTSLPVRLEQILRDAVRRRVVDVAQSKHVAVLFSGGLDSAVRDVIDIDYHHLL